MPEICDDSIWQCVGYVGCDCVDRAVPEDGNEYSFRMLLSEPLCVITDDMTHQEKTGTIYDYDYVNDNIPGYFDYDDPRDYEEWGGWDDPGDYGMYYDPYRSDVTNDETVVSLAWLGVQSDGTLAAPELTVTEITDQHLRSRRNWMESPGCPCLGPMDESLVIFRFCAWTPRYRKIPGLEHRHSRKPRVLQVNFMYCPGSFYLGPGD